MKSYKELITAHDLAEALDLSVETIWKYSRQKKIPYVELGSKQYRYKLDDVIKSLSVQEESANYEFKSYENENEPTKEESAAINDKLEPIMKLTYQDYLEIPDEPGYRFEILDGILIKEPSPNVIHQRVSRRIQRILEDYLWEFDAEGEIFNAPLDVTFYEYTVVQPDIFYISGAQKRIVKETRIDGPPALVIEILSPSTGRKDRLQKMRIYQKAPVQHYWLINPMEKTLECFALQNDIYALVASGMDEDIVIHPDFSGLAIELEKLW